MPEMSGFEFITELRSRAEWRDTPVVVMTAKDLTDEDRRQLDGGVAYVLRKSANSPEDFLVELRETLEQVIRRRRAAEARKEAA
jgi:CheY-like chemotaxis protein